jgi:glycerophosphoryl diester phosphodiesterase
MKYNLFFLSLLSFMSCKLSGHRNFDLEGHRGCRGNMPENTIPAMIKAIDLGVNTLEMDLVITADKKVVVSHEPYFNHEITTLPDGDTIDSKDEWKYNIYHMTYDSVKLYDVGMKPHPRFPLQQKMRIYKPLFSDLIDSVEAYCERTNHQLVNYNIEIKSLDSSDNLYHPAPEEYVDLVMKVVNDKKIARRVILQSFDVRSLRVASKKYPGIKLSYLVDIGTKIPENNFEKLLGFHSDIISPDYSLVTKHTIRMLHDQGILVIPWTVDDLETAKKLYEMGVDGIITDYPDRVSLNTIEE